jgi:hypothetical protein
MAVLVDLVCPACGESFKKAQSLVNMNLKLGHKVYCGAYCSHEGQRKNEILVSTREITLPSVKFMNCPPPELYDGPNWRKKVSDYLSARQQPEIASSRGKKRAATR